MDGYGKKLVVFSREYDCDSLCDLEQDVSEAVQADYNPLVAHVTGEFTGTFTVTIHYTPGDDE